MINFKVLVIFLTACLASTHGKLDKYCSICQDHTMCKYEGIGEKCTDPGEGGVSDAERREILDLHNWYRSLVAAGQEVRGEGGGQPKAANMLKLVWDEGLEEVAQRWADQCQFGHDTCRDDPRWKVGQNVFWKFKSPVHHVNWTEAISSWYSEVALFNPAHVRKYTFAPETGHYTQMIWHDSYALGCGRRDYGLNKLYICNYGPTGNWIDEPVYEHGEPCSKCPHQYTCEDFLCASSNPPLEESLRIGANFYNLFDPTAEQPNNRHADTIPSFFTPPVTSTIQAFSQSLKQSSDDSDLKATKRSFDANKIEYDEDTRKQVEDLKERLDELVKSLIKKYSNIK